VKRLLCRLFGCHCYFRWVDKEELSPGFVVEKRWQMTCRWCGDWSLIPPNLCRRCGAHELYPDGPSDAVGTTLGRKT